MRKRGEVYFQAVNEHGADIIGVSQDELLLLERIEYRKGLIERVMKTDGLTVEITPFMSDDEGG